MRRSMWVYPWDLADDGPEAVAGRAAGLGLTGLSVTSVYHAARVLLPHNRRRRVWYAEDGAAYFRPNPARYGKLVPPVSRLTDGRDLLCEAADAARKAGLALALWTVCLHNGALAAAHLDCAAENAFGDRLEQSLCPSNEHVREYAAALVTDLAGQYAPQTLDLESATFTAWDPSFRLEIGSMALSPLARFLLGLCFCTSCRRQAKARAVDPELVRKWVRRSADRALAGVSPSEEADLWAAFPPEWTAMRQAVVTGLHERLAEAVRPFGTRLRPILFPLPEEAPRLGIDIAALGSLHGAFLVNCYADRPATVAERWSRYAAAVPPAAETGACLRVGHGFLASGADVRKAVDGLAAAGAGEVCFYNYGIMSEVQMSWMKEGLAGVHGAADRRPD